MNFSMGRKKRVVGKIIWGPRKSHMKENGMVSKSTFIDINESGKFCLCVYGLCVAMICRHKCTGKETFTSRSDNTC